MALVKLTFVCFLLVLIFCQEIQFIEVRDMKLERANAFPKLQSYRKILNKEVNNIYDLESKSHGDEHPTVKVAKDILSPPTAPSDGVGESMPPPSKTCR
ncbi:hypothetical protein OWV82_013328 [Melia azedarach]|uniref:Uncharacterized protein n=1 Tax=Melia azedarach TaxID=155640 RepID=A0ACC1XU22_MELAZ|nr:hypothetical protein OWV82_013328 [Melia azedarach]